MSRIPSRKTNKPRQYILSVLLVCIVSGVCFFFINYLGYHAVAYLLLITVSLIAMVYDIRPVLVAAILSAIIWDYFFIPPHFTLQVASAEDTILLAMYFVIALLNGTLTYKIRQAEKRASKKEEKASTLKLYDTLLNSLSHELRTPIATIIGATDNLQAHNANLTEANKEELVNEISKASVRLNQQVENLLNMSKLESGVMQLRRDWCDVGEVIYDTLKRVEETDEAHTIKIDLSADLPLFKLDNTALEQILYNILINACNYTPAGSAIHVAATCDKDVLQIVITDNGKGFPEGELQHVFEKFYRLRNERTGGTGLGLSIVKGFTEALNGTVCLENISTGGAKFTIEIPAETSYLKNLKNE